MSRCRFLVAAVLLCLGLAVPSAAVTINASSVGSSFNVLFNGNVSRNPVPGLSAAGAFSVVSFSSQQLVLDIALTNSTSAALFQSARVSALGFDTSRAISSSAVGSNGLFAHANTGGQFPNGFGAVGVCIIDNKNNCTGGGNGGVNLGQTGTTRMTLNFASAGSSVDLSNFGVRYQSITSQKLGLQGASGTGAGNGGPVPGVPEPGAAALFGVGLALVAGATRRRRTR